MPDGLGPAPPRPIADRRALARRIVSALVLMPLVLAAEWAGGTWFEAMVGVIVAISAWEWGVMCGLSTRGWSLRLFMLACILLAIAPGRGLPIDPMALAAIGLAILLALIWMRAAHRRMLGVGAVYVGLAGAAAIGLRAADSSGDGLVVWLMVVTWSADTGAFVVGRLLGGPRLAPRASPAKTWSGAIGAVVIAALIGGILAFVLQVGGALGAAVSGAVVGVVAVAGDLLESIAKRHFGVKDSGRLIPGHGGVLDRIDSLLLVLIVAAAAHLIGWRLA